MLLLVREKTSRFATVRVRAVTFVFVDDVEDVEDVEDRGVEDHDEEGLDGWYHDGLVLLVREKTFRFATIRASMSFFIEDEDDEIIVINNSIDRAVRETMLMKRGRPEDEEKDVLKLMIIISWILNRVPQSDYFRNQYFRLNRVHNNQSDSVRGEMILMTSDISCS